MGIPDKAEQAPDPRADLPPWVLGVRELLARQGIPATEAQVRGAAKTLARLAPPLRRQEAPR
ncbi:Uncharacterised protein [Achromobacter denitrificans]|uniref:hypothetical protein n=1 Tax=Achromobacter denitrificans TaxID=32002 RepID=UPI0007883947|nr:hypothetical protein [Achromobacter denitrificans]OLU08785.1 hypothetical protein BVK87_08025 [Achromobacter denitrificans]QKH45364.1 hypothetical protein FOC82_29340 [Achromobacter denitrificans]QKH53294.1 hypothetical protein FOC80_29130 [Achromobacter denitrificans]CAB3656218.1 hypothetical protein LMG1231_00296 [Achromobacter denitrificans]SUW34128.1 Uncharacterised protein [Achromobacter denitrificans]